MALRRSWLQANRQTPGPYQPPSPNQPPLPQGAQYYRGPVYGPQPIMINQGGGNGKPVTAGGVIGLILLWIFFWRTFIPLIVTIVYCCTRRKASNQQQIVMVQQPQQPIPPQPYEQWQQVEGGEWKQ